MSFSTTMYTEKNLGRERKATAALQIDLSNEMNLIFELEGIADGERSAKYEINIPKEKVANVIFGHGSVNASENEMTVSVSLTKTYPHSLRESQLSFALRMDANQGIIPHLMFNFVMSVEETNELRTILEPSQASQFVGETAGEEGQ